MVMIAAGCLLLLAALMKHLRYSWYFLHIFVVIGTCMWLEKEYGMNGVDRDAFVMFLQVHLASINVVTFLAYGYDKAAAIQNRWRIPERVFHAFALIGATPAAIISRKIFQHKTSKKSFIAGFWNVIFIQIIVGALILYAPFILKF